MRWFWGIALVVCTACVESAPLDLPEVPDDVRATILIVETDRGERRTYAYDIGDPPPTLAIRSKTSLVVAHYDRDLTALGLTRGPLTRALEPDPGRPLPEPTALRVAQKVDGVVSPFEEVGADYEAFVAIRLPGRPLEDCLDERGCYVRDDDIEARVCTNPCPHETPEPASPPVPPTPPDLSACPPGWSDAREGTTEFCEPPARSPGCAAHEAQWLDSTACIRVGSPCPAAGDWSAALPTDRPVVYVRAGDIGGDGSRGAPFGSIAAALASSSGERVLALTGGRYPESVTLVDGVTLFGACTEETIVEAPSGNTIEQAAGAATLENLRVVGALRGIEIFGTADLALTNVVVEGSGAQAIVRVRSGALHADGLLVRGRGEAGLHVAEAASARVSRAHVEVDGRDVWATGANTVVTIDDAALVEPPVATSGAARIEVAEGARVDLVRVHVVGSGRAGLLARSAAAVIEDGYFEGARGQDGAAIRAIDGATVDVHRAVVRDVDGYGARITASTSSISDVVFLDVAASFVVFEEAASGSLRRVAGYRAARDGLIVWNTGTSCDAEDLRFESMLDNGLELGPGTAHSLRRLEVLQVANFGTRILGSAGLPPTTRRIEDLRIDDVGGVGVDVTGPVEVVLRRVVLSNIVGHGLFPSGHPIVDIHDLTIDGAFMGVRTDDQAELRAMRLTLRRTTATGLCIKGDSQAVVTDVLVEDPSTTNDTQGVFCAIGVPISGSGIMVNNLATLTLTRYAVRRAPGIGFSIRGPDSVWATDGSFEDNMSAMQVAAEVDLEDVLRTTTFADNAVALDLQ